MKTGNEMKGTKQVNTYTISREWFDWSFEHPDLVKPSHTAIYFYAIDQNNRFGWKEKFGLPTLQAMEATGIKSKNTYYKAFNNLIEWDFIRIITKAKNANSANIISIPAVLKFKSVSNSVGNSVLDLVGIQQEDSRGNIDKQINNETNKPLNQDYCEKEFLKDWNELRSKHLRKPSHLQRIGAGIERSNFNDLLKTYSREDFRKALIGLFKQKTLPNDNKSMQTSPQHLLSKFEYYHTAFYDQNEEVWGKQKIEAYD